jgi:hypothetical protein
MSSNQTLSGELWLFDSVPVSFNVSPTFQACAALCTIAVAMHGILALYAIECRVFYQVMTGSDMQARLWISRVPGPLPWISKAKWFI